MWNEAELEFPSHLSEMLMSDVEHPVECIQNAAAQSLAALLETDREHIPDTITKLLKTYRQRLHVIELNLN